MPLPSFGWLLTALLLFTPFADQERKRPDFSGTWVAVSPGDEALGEMVIKQTEKTIEVRIGSEGHRSVYHLDGSESRNSNDSNGEKIVTVSRTAWKDGQFIITSLTTYPDGSKSESVDSWSIDAKGQLVVEGNEKMTSTDGIADGSGKLHLVFRRK